MKLRDTIVLLTSDILIALSITLALEGLNLQLFGKLMLMIALNIFSLPLFLVFHFPWWVCYIIIVVWGADIFFIVAKSKREKSNTSFKVGDIYSEAP